MHFAQGPEEALDILKEHEVDVVVSDHLMPSMDGLTFLKLVKNLYPHVIRIILTGHADLQMAIEAINEGEVFRFLTKPWNDIELKVTLGHIFEYLALRRENQTLLTTVQKQQDFIDRLDAEHPGILEVKRDKSGAIIIDESVDL
jgi:DNA-binding NtrC family response regulator